MALARRISGVWPAVRWRAGTTAELSDAASRARYLVLSLGWGRRGTVVPLRVTALGGRPLWVRPRGGDVAVLTEAFARAYAEPPPELGDRPLETIVELGTHIGASLCRLAHRNPGARLLGVEADPGNAALARRNTRPWADRVHVLEAAVWTGARQVELGSGSGLESGLVADQPEAGSSSGLKVRARTVDEILDGFASDRTIDYLYMDLEGTHERLVRGRPPWLERVRAIKVAGHAGTAYSDAACARDLVAAGFQARVEPFESNGWAVGVRA